MRRGPDRRARSRPRRPRSFSSLSRRRTPSGSGRPDHVVGVRADLEGTVLDRFEERFDPHAPDAISVLMSRCGHWLLKPRSDLHSARRWHRHLPGVVDSPRSESSAPDAWLERRSAGCDAREVPQVPVVVESDVNALAVAERLTAEAGR